MLLSLHRFVTLLLLGLQLVALGVGALPEREACCCVSRGKVCKCKSHGHKAKPAEGPCVTKRTPGCGTPNEVTFSPLTWVALPEPEATALPAPLELQLEWSLTQPDSYERSDVRRPPPRRAS